MASSSIFTTGIGLGDFLKSCWYATSINGTALTSDLNPSGSVIISLVAINRAQGLVLEAVPDIVGLVVYTLIFGLSLAVSLLSGHYLLKNWRRDTSNIIVTGFTLLLSAFNIAVFGLRIATVLNAIRESLCPSGIPPFRLAFQLDAFTASSGGGVVYGTVADLITAWNVAKGVTLTVIPAFLWVSDAFLLYRAWVIWVYHRKYTIIPGVAYTTSLVCGVAWIIEDYNATRLNQFSLHPNLNFLNGVLNWTTALGFSCGLDTLTTGMIAGRLIYYHRRQRKLTGRKTTFYLPIVTIFIESAALSLISKILQLSLSDLRTNPIVVPLCTISSNLIILRKALGADVGQMMANRELEDLSTLSFKHNRPRVTKEGDVPGGFEAHLVQTKGAIPSISDPSMQAPERLESLLSGTFPRNEYELLGIQKLPAFYVCRDRSPDHIHNF